MRVAGLATYVALCYDIFRNTFAQAVIKHEVLSPELVFQPLFLYGIGIMDDAPFQVKDIGKSLMEEISAGFFTTYSSRTVHDDVLFPVVRQHAGRHRQLLSESIRRHFDSLVIPAHLAGLASVVSPAHAGRP